MHSRNIIYTGKVDFVNANHAFIIVENLEKDILVTYTHLKGAMHGDIVKVALVDEKKSSRQEGIVVAIISRIHHKVVGCIIHHEGQKVIMPDHKRLHRPIILVKNANSPTAKVDDKVVGSFIKYPTTRSYAQATLIKILGPKGSYQAETNSILEEYGLDTTFPPSVQRQASLLPDELSEKEKGKRRDFTQIPTFTIDPVDAKDFDDALSVKKLSNGGYEIGIHIADVTHYVKKDTPLDLEAQKRGTSVYLVGNCVPMLPERLSNHLCSLNPKTTRPAFSLVVTFDEQANIKDSWLGETMIYSDHRFTYEEAQEIIEKKQGKFSTEINLLNQLAKKLRKKRIKKGALAFETTELNIELKKTGQPSQIKPKKINESNNLIEEYMLVANTLIAEKIGGKKGSINQPIIIHRSHDQPQVLKLEELSLTLKELGFSFNKKAKHLGQELNKLLQAIKNTPLQNIITNLVIRSMPQAYYTPDPKPHFGLNALHYTHFTSPIRRYSDLYVHRALKQHLLNKKPFEKKLAAQIASEISAKERIAIEAERISIRAIQVQFLKKREGQTYQGTISSIKNWGIYIQLIENGCEGMIKMSDLKDDYYELHPTSSSITGRRYKKTYKIGDIVSVKIKYCNIEKKTTDLIFEKT